MAASFQLAGFGQVGNLSPQTSPHLAQKFRGKKLTGNIQFDGGDLTNTTARALVLFEGGGIIEGNVQNLGTVAVEKGKGTIKGNLRNALWVATSSPLNQELGEILVTGDYTEVAGDPMVGILTSITDTNIGRLTVAKKATIVGTLQIRPPAKFNPAANAEFVPLAYGSRDGQFGKNEWTVQNINLNADYKKDPNKLILFRPKKKGQGININPNQGIGFTSAVGTFTDPGLANPVPTDFTAMINWGDGTAPSLGLITVNPSGGFDVIGSHTYDSFGLHVIEVTVTDVDNTTASLTMTGTATVVNTSPVDVTHEYDGNTLRVTFTIVEPTPDWYLEVTRLEVSSDRATLDGNIGNDDLFGMATAHDPLVKQFVYEIPVTWPAATDVYILGCADLINLANVVREETDLDALAANLPATGTITVQNPGTLVPPASYWDITFSNAGFLSGIYNGWCVDTSRILAEGPSYPVDLYSSYEVLPAGAVDHPENLDLVNWMINQGYVGQSSPGGYGVYTYGDVQRAMWALMEDTFLNAGLGPWNQFRVDELVAAALNDSAVPELALPA